MTPGPGRKRRTDIPIHRIAEMRIEGKGWLRISNELKIPKTTILDRRKQIYAEMEAMSKT